jgi:CheY-like chemotaxis protein
MAKRTQPTGEQDAPPMIFIADDNPVLAELGRTILEAAGYRVKDFCDPARLLRTLHATKAKPQVLITDYDMGAGSMTGLEVAEFARRIHPALKIVVLSGTVEKSVILGHPSKVDRFLGKPYQPASLKMVVSQLLG